MHSSDWPGRMDAVWALPGCCGPGQCSHAPAAAHGSQLLSSLMNYKSHRPKEILGSWLPACELRFPGGGLSPANNGEVSISPTWRWHALELSLGKGEVGLQVETPLGLASSLPYPASLSPGQVPPRGTISTDPFQKIPCLSFCFKRQWPKAHGN